MCGGKEGDGETECGENDFTSFSFMALVNACIFSSEQEEGEMVTEGVWRKKGEGQQLALQARQKGKRRMRRQRQGKMGIGS